MKLQKCKKYITGLRTLDGKLMIEMRKKTGFCGVLTCINALKMIYENLCDNPNILKYIETHKMSLDHIELLFKCVRPHNGGNNNPICRQFKSIVKRILIHTKLRKGGSSLLSPTRSYFYFSCIIS